MSNDANEVVFIQILSPRGPSSKLGGSWSAKIVTTFPVQQIAAQVEDPAMLYTEVFRPRYPISQLALTSWVASSSASQEEQGKLCCTLAYIAGTELHLKRCEVKLSHDGPLFTIDENTLVIPGTHSGPLQWSYQVSKEYGGRRRHMQLRSK